MGQTVRGTQTLVDQMGWVFHRPTLVLLEVTWRWVVGLPLLAVVLAQARDLALALPPAASGLAELDTRNPWLAATQLAQVWTRYQPLVAPVAAWLVPLALLAWCLASAVGRAALLRALVPGARFRPAKLVSLQAAWLLVWCAVVGSWLAAMRWNAVRHILTAAGEPDLIGFAMWTIVLSLGFFTLWALVSWPLAVAPLLALTEDRNPASALAASLRLGRPLSGKLVETNLVMGIVKLALIVLAMVFSAAPLPFSDQLGPEAMRLVWLAAIAFWLLASDYFHVVRLKGYVEFCRALRPASKLP